MKCDFRHVRWLGAGAAVVALVWLVTLPLGVASAHSADMYLQDESLVFTTDGLRVDWRITPGPLLAGALWSAADLNNDGTVSQEEALTFIKPILSQWTVKVDDQPLGGARRDSISWPKTLDALQAGDKPMDVSFTFNWPGPLVGRHRVEIHNAIEEIISLNWFSVTSESGVSFAEPQQANGLLQTDVYFPSIFPGTPALTAWASGQPNVPGLSTLSNAAASLSGSNPSSASANPPAGPAAALSSLVWAQALSAAFLLTAFLLSLALGALHALTPGHGKTLVAAYLVGSQGRTRDAVFLGSVVTATHTGSVLLLGVVTLVASRYVLPAVFVPVLELLSGLFVLGFGFHLLVQRGRALYAWYNARRALRRKALHGTAALAGEHDHEAAPQGPHGHDHDRGHDHAHGHAHVHPHSHELPSPDGPHDNYAEPRPASAPAGHQVTWRSLLTLGVSGGLVPCPDAIAILLVAVAVNRIPLGMLLIVAFSLGLAVVLIVIGIAMVNGMRFISKSDLVNRFTVYAPTLSALAVCVLGLGLTVTAASSAFFSPAGGSAVAQGLPPTATPPAAAESFDLKKARVLYLADAEDQQMQIFVRAAVGGKPVQITQEPAGVYAFALSSDGKTVLYHTSRPAGVGSAMWAIGVDGTERRQVLDCPQADCVGPVWSPDGRQVIYERTDYAQNLPALLPSIWWLDPQSGATRPVFQDQQLPSFAPRFSADGRWLSYISPASQTLQVYELSGSTSVSLPYHTNVPEVWSPVGDAFLYWDQTAEGESRLRAYDMATNRKADLSGAADESDFTAAWSPDSQWIAMTRAGLTTTADGTALQEGVWLIRPNGAQARQLFSEVGGFLDDLQWSPDGRYLVYARDGDAGTTDIRFLDVQTGQETTVTPGGQQPVWGSPLKSPSASPAACRSPAGGTGGLYASEQGDCHHQRLRTSRGADEGVD